MNYLDLLKRTVAAFNDDKAQRLAAALAFSTIFAIAPLFVILIAAIGAILGIDGNGGHTTAENTLLDEVAKNTGTASAETVRKLIDASFAKPRQGVLAQTIGWIAFAFTASNLFASLQDALNAVWHVEATKGGWQQMLRVRARSFAMIALIGLLLFATLVANAAITFVGAHFLASIPIAKNPTVLTLIEQGVSLVLTTVAFGLLFKVLPDVKVAWRDVWVGSIVTAFLFIAGEALISLYIAYGGVASGVRRGGLAPRRPRVDLLLRADPYGGRRVHESVRDARRADGNSDGSRTNRTAGGRRSALDRHRRALELLDLTMLA